MIILRGGDSVGEADGGVYPALVLVLVLAVAYHAFGRPALDGSEAVVAEQLSHMVGYTFFIKEFFGLK